jgi:hypothetical protein
MVARAQELAERFERAVAEFAGAVEGLSDEQWLTTCANEERTVAALTRHVAIAIPFEMRVFHAFARGHQPAPITRAWLNAMNAEDGARWAQCDRAETLALLRDNATTAAAVVRGLGAEQLQQTGRYLDDMPEPWTLEQWLERILIGHVTGHLASIRAALAAT